MQQPQMLANRYILEQTLGSGGMGRVYRATDRLTGEVVALKRVLAKAQNLTFQSRPHDDLLDLRLALAGEFRTLAGLRHPNIISVLDYGFDDEQRPYYTMQLIENPVDLLDAAADKDYLEKSKLLMQLLEALEYLHRRNILHRDLKPENALLDGDTVKLLDFGLSMSDEFDVDSSSGGNIAGTLHYLAPELLRGEPHSVASDLYAVGVMAYQIFTDELPFDADTTGQIRMEILYGKPDLPHTGLYRKVIPILLNLLDKDPTQRTASAHEVILRLQDVLGIEHHASYENYLQSAKFVGRQDELSQLLKYLRRTPRKQGSAMLIAGETGVGKTRLAEELSHYALVENIQVLRGSCAENSFLPYEAWRDPLRKLILNNPPNTFDAGVLKEIVPDIALLMGRDIPNVPPLPNPANNERLIMTIIAQFRAIKRPTLLILDDLHWAEESLDVLIPLSQIIFDLPLFIVSAYRSDEPQRLAEKFAHANHMRLPRLPRAALDALCVSILGEGGRNDALLDYLMTESDGNIFFILEVIRALSQEAGDLDAVGQMPLPEHSLSDNINALMKRRLSRLSDNSWFILRLAAAYGRWLDLDLLMTIDPKLNLESWLLDCAEAATIEADGDGWRFTHDHLREGVLDDLTKQQRRDLHWQIATALETLYGDNPDYLTQIMKQWELANEDDKMRHYGWLAAEAEMKRGNFYNAIHYLEQALQLWTLVPSADDIRRQAEYLHELGYIYSLVGDTSAAKSFLEASIVTAKSIEDNRHRALALSKMGSVFYTEGNYEEAYKYHEASLGLALYVDDKRITANFMTNLGMVNWRLGNLAKATEYFEKSKKLSGEVNDQAGVARAIKNIGVVTSMTDTQAAIPHLNAALVLAKSVGDKMLVASCLGNLGACNRDLEDFDQAVGYYTDALEICQETGYQHGMADMLANIGSARLQMADFEGAWMALTDSLRIATRIGSTAIALEAIVGIAAVLHHRGENALALQLLSMARHHPSSDRSLKHISDGLWQTLEEFWGTDAAPHIEAGQALDLDTLTDEILGEPH